MDQNLEKNILRRWVSLCYFKVELSCPAYFNSTYHVSSNNCSPPSTAAPTSWAKISNKRPSRISAPIPSLLTFLNSRDTRKACFYCHIIYDFLRFNYNKDTYIHLREKCTIGLPCARSPTTILTNENH